MRLATCVHLEHGRRCKLELAADADLPSACQTCDSYEGMARGLGDFIGKMADVTGIKAVTRQIEAATGKPCGCGERRAALNRMIPFGPER